MDLTADEEKNTILALLNEAYLSRVNNLTRSTELAGKALALSRGLDNHALIAKSLSQLSLFYMIKGEYKQSMSMAEEAIKFFVEVGDEKGLADAKYNIAGIHYKTDNYHLGLTHLIDCLAIYRKFNDYHNQSRTEKSLGTIYEYFGDQKNAIKSYEGAIESARAAGDLNLESNAYNNLSGVYIKQNRIDDALDMIEKSIAMKKQTGDVRGMAFALHGRGKVYTKTGKYHQAEEDFLAAMKIHDEMGERLGMGMVLHKLGRLYIEMGRLNKAKETLKKGIEFSNTYNIVIIKFKCDYQLYRISKETNNHAAALDYLEKYLKEKELVINTQTLQVIENYELITKMDVLEKEAKLEKEKAEIIAKKERAEHEARVRQEFLSTMSHEIRTPLNAVLTFTSLFKDKTDPEEKELVDSLKYSANHLLRIINDILEFTQLDSGKVRLEKRPFSLHELAQTLYNIYGRLTKDKGLELRLHVQEGIAEAYEMDDVRLTQIIGNLLSNALKFTDKGSIELFVEKTGSDADSDTIRFKVKDTGQGISADYFEKIFESFTLTQSVTTRKQGGTGLGLAIVKKLVELHGSQVQVESSPGRGSAFCFDLQLKRHFAATQASDSAPVKLQNKTCLLAEDNEINALVARRLLEHWGVVIEVAKNGLEAIEKADLKHYDFVLMDIHMPEMNGYDATAHIRQHENPNKQTPIFALTADITAADQKEYVPFFNGFLWKPLEVEKLYEALKNVS